MVYLNQIFLGILALQLYVNAAPNDVGKIEDIATAADSKLDPGPVPIEEDESSIETARQKRNFNPYPFAQFNPFFYSNPDVTGFGVEDPLADIYKRVQSITNNLRQPPPLPPPIQQVPIFIPVLYIPPADCSCNPPNPQPQEPANPNNNNTTPDVIVRFPEMEDERQNWGIAVNDSAQNDDGRDYSRPISFDPIRLNLPNMRPLPPVERDTVQGEAADNQQPSTESSQSTSTGNGQPRPPPSSNAGIPPSNARPQTPFINKQPSTSFPLNGFASAPPSPCDGAILTCCHRPQITYDCFAIQGCPNFTPFGNPCNSASILRIIQRFQNFYGNRS